MAMLSMGFNFPSVSLLRRQLDMFDEGRSLLAGAVGGPCAVFVLTPQRNAMTLSAKQYGMSFFGLYRQVFSEGLLKGFRGGYRPTVMSVPQFTAIGPMYLAMEKRTGCVPLSMLFASAVESLLTYSAQKRNAQIQYNAVIKQMGTSGGKRATELRLTPMYNVVGPGFTFHVMRNVFAMLGIRLLSPHSRQIVERIPGSTAIPAEALDLSADFVSSIAAAALSMPFNHVFSWTACSPEIEQLSYVQRARASAAFLVTNYTERGVRLLGRDLAVRISYTGFLFTIYRCIERQLVD
mmetsp:Transcript_96774/g.273452  ORF Transcript_96774/g.273452 Transcript_96774/m.273452 type:complete len:293 (+) Transcript_96774:209-1087(+)